MSTHEEYYNRFGESIPTPSFSRASSTAPRIQLPPNVLPPPPPKPSFKAVLPVASPLPSVKKFTVLKPISTPTAGSLTKGKAKEMEIDSENNPPAVARQNSKKREREGETGEENLSMELRQPEEEEDEEEILPSPRPSQRRGPCSEPLDLSNRSLDMDDDTAMDVDSEVLEKSRETEARRIAKGKGKEVVVAVEGKKLLLPKVALLSKMVPVEIEVQSHYYIVSTSYLPMPQLTK